MAVKDTLKFWIRPVSEDDYPACMALDHASSSHYVWQVEAHEEQGRFTYSFRSVRLPRAMTVTLPQYGEAAMTVWPERDFFVVAEGADHKVLGYLNLQIDRANGIGWVRELVVDRGYRRRRVGSGLLHEAQKWSHANGLQRITLETQTKNYPAIMFCQRHGLVFCGFNDRYYPNQDIALFFTQSVR
jgi:ribosomal protein S18 acetylase RimI-like enzyme